MKRVTLFLAAFLFACSAFTQKTSTVFFDLNYNTTESIAPVHVEIGRMMKISDKSFPATGLIRVSGKSDEGCLYIGGLVGSERYGTVSNSTSHVKMSVINSPSAQVGGIVGEFNSNYGTIGAAFGINTTKISGCTYVGKPSFRNVPNHVFGEIAGAGEPETLTSPWGLSMNYKIENCTYKKK